MKERTIKIKDHFFVRIEDSIMAKVSNKSFKTMHENYAILGQLLTINKYLFTIKSKDTKSFSFVVLDKLAKFHYEIVFASHVI